MEEWKRITDFPNYFISNFGRVKRVTKTKERYVAITINNNGYQTCCLYDLPLKRKTLFIHRLVAEHFLPNPANKPTVHHKDTNPTNNNVSNLQWATYSEQAMCRHHKDYKIEE